MLTLDREKANILLVDDQETNTRLLRRLLNNAGFSSIRSLNDPRTVLSTYLLSPPDMVVVDYRMPHMDGLEVIEQLRQRIPEDTYLPILMITGDGSQETAIRALATGANDFLTRPFNATEVVLRIECQLSIQALHAQVLEQNTSLEQRIAERTRELETAHEELLWRLALAGEFRDDDTGEHAHRVGTIAALVAQELGLDKQTVETIGKAARLHDVGKIGIPDAVLLQPGKLTPEEFDVIKTHTTIGAQLLGKSASPVLRMGQEIALNHHENWDGSGYPAGLTGEAIPASARLVSIVDVFDALSSDRPYRPAWSTADIFQEILRLSGVKFDPVVVEAFFRVVKSGRVPGAELETPLQRVA